MIISEIQFGARLLSAISLKQSDAHPGLCSIYRLTGGWRGGRVGRVTGNMFNGTCNGDTSSRKSRRDNKRECIFQFVISRAAKNELTTRANDMS